MPSASKVYTFSRAVVVAPGTSVAPADPVPANCTAVTLYNSGTAAALVGIETPGTALTAGVNAAIIPANGGTITLPIGPISERGDMDNATNPGKGFVYDSAGVGGLTVYIIYKNLPGVG